MTPQEIYDNCIITGGSPRLAEMLACKKAPASQTDVEFFRGRGTLEDQIGTDVLNTWSEENKRTGFNPGINSVYIGQLARFPNDPQAYVPASGGKTYVRNLLRKRGDGSAEFRVQAREAIPDTPVKLAPDLVEDGIRQLIKDNPNKKKQKRKALAEEVVHKHGAKTSVKNILI